MPKKGLSIIALKAITVEFTGPAPYQLSYDVNNYILFKLMDDGLYVCIRVFCPLLYCLR